MALVRPRLRRLPRRGSISLAAVVFGIGCALLILVPHPMLLVGFSVCGIGAGVGDVAINAAGNDLETSAERPVLQWVHGGNSMGAVVGAVGAGVALAVGIGFRPLLLVASVLPLLAAYLVAITRALDVSVEGEPTAPPASGPHRLVPSPELLVPAVVIICGLLLEGSLDIWSALYLRRGLAASVLIAGVSLGAFALSMALGRSFAARVLFSLGYRVTIATSAIGTVALGLVLALSSGPLIAGIALLVLGFFLAPAMPAGYGIIEGTQQARESGVAWVTGASYVSYMVGPPIMGWLADALGLRATMLLLALLGLPILAGAVPARARRGASHHHGRDDHSV